MSAGAAFHFLRPWWLLALVPLALLVWQLNRRAMGGEIWKQLCDPHLLANLMIRGDLGTRAWLILLGAGWLFGVLALAGPTWNKLEVPVFKTGRASVIVLDLSTSMGSGDLKPSRLAHAKFKLLDILQRKRAEQTALVVFANEAFVVSPLTDDANTIAALVPVLETEIMPAQGSRLDRALRTARELLEPSPPGTARVIVLSDSAHRNAAAVAAELAAQGIEISVLGVGTTGGAPIPDPNGGFVKDYRGSIVVPGLDRDGLQRLAEAGSGLYAELSVDDSDLNYLLGPVSDQGETRETKLSADQWRDDGIWLVLLVIPLASLAFRKGWLMVFVAFSVAPPQPAHAFTWDDLWWREDQQAAALLQQGQAYQAAEKFRNQRWRGTANYRAGRYDEAAAAFANDDTPDGHYNRGNALAKLGKLNEALEAYQAALDIAPQHEDAQFNKSVLEQIRREQLKIDEADQQNRPQGERSTGAGTKDAERDGDGSDQQADRSGESDSPSGGASDKARREEELESMNESQAERARAEAALNRELTDGENRREEESEDASAGTNPSDSANDLDNTLAMSKLSEEDLQALEQWLRQIPDDPGGLLRRKLLLEHRRRQLFGEFEEVEEPW